MKPVYQLLALDDTYTITRLIDTPQDNHRAARILAHTWLKDDPTIYAVAITEKTITNGPDIIERVYR